MLARFRFRRFSTVQLLIALGLFFISAPFVEEIEGGELIVSARVGDIEPACFDLGREPHGNHRKRSGPMRHWGRAWPPFEGFEFKLEQACARGEERRVTREYDLAWPVAQRSGERKIRADACRLAGRQDQARMPVQGLRIST